MTCEQEASTTLTLENFSHVGECLFGLALHIGSDQLHRLRVHSQLTGNVHRVARDHSLDKNKGAPLSELSMGSARRSKIDTDIFQ